MSGGAEHRPLSALETGSKTHVVLTLFALAVVLMFAKPLLPEWLIRVPEWMILPWDQWLQAMFDFIREDLGLIYLTRSIASGLEFVLDATANMLYGKNRWPKLGPIPWVSITGAIIVLAYWLGGFRLAALAIGTFIWTALVGQWDIAMQTMSVLIVAAPIAAMIGILLGILSWKYSRVEKFLQPILAVLQTLPFFTYLLPAVIFFKVGPTAAAVATVVFAAPPMILMTTLGLRQVSPEVIEAGHMSGATRWQMLRHVYLPSARTEILVGVNQVIMLSLAMVVLTAFIGMPGLGAKLLSMMNSFKIGRSFEIGITIVLFAVMLDRLSKAWVLKQPQHFEKGTPWWRQHAMLLIGIFVFIGMTIIAQLASSAPHYTLTEGAKQGNFFQYAWSILDDIHRTQDLSQGKQIDNAIKAFLDIDSVQAATESFKAFLIVDVLIPFRNALLDIPVIAFVLLVAGISYFISGLRSAIVGGSFFAIIAFLGWWDRAIITLYTVISAVTLAMIIGLPLAIWASRGAASGISFKSGILHALSGIIGLIFIRLPILLLAAIVGGSYHFFSGDSETMPFLSFSSPAFYIFIGVFLLLWLIVRNWPRDKVMLAIVDTAQTFPSFVYLIPAIMLFSINDVAVVFSILIFTLVPLIRYTIEGLRNVPPEIMEAADMSGATRMQKLWHVQLPLALPTMAIGFNQAIMFAFFMVIIAAFIGTQDIGQELQRTLAGGDLGKNFVLGMNISLMALAFDYIIIRWVEQRKKILGLD